MTPSLNEARARAKRAAVTIILIERDSARHVAREPLRKRLDRELAPGNVWLWGLE